MGRVDYEAALASAERHEKAKALQEKVSTVETDAVKLDQRREFLRPADRVFFESIVEGSDLLPIRYLASA